MIDQRAEQPEEPGERISEAEHAVMEALWEASPLTATEVSDKVSGQRGWSLATVKTLLSRLVAKKFTCDAWRTIAFTNAAASAMTCSQLSSTITTSRPATASITR